MNRVSTSLLLVLVLALIVLPFAAAAQPLAPDAARALEELKADAGEPDALRVSPRTGLVTFLGFSGRPDGGLVLPLKASAPAEERARAFLAGYGKAFGVDGGADLLARRISEVDAAGMEHVRFQQTAGGVPVTAGELTVHLRGNRVRSVLGETLADLGDFDVEPQRDAGGVAESVRQRVIEQVGHDDFTLSAPRLEVFNRGVLDEGLHPTRLAWFVEARRIDLREYLWVDDRTGDVLLQFSQLPHARNRWIHDANSGSGLPGTTVRREGEPATGDADADAAYDFSGDTYDYFFTVHGRDSYNGAGATLRSTVDFCPGPPDPCPYPNAFWNGSQMVYGAGFSRADDVDAHELTHAVTEHTADLFYYMQSGALNESFSDMFGETVDLTNGAGDDSAGVRWLMGEDVPGGGAIRNMMNPNAFGDPARTGDGFFWCNAASDQGGVHTNSSVPNHAYALMADGGIFNGKTVNTLGLTKAGKVAYRVLSEYLTSGSGFHDAYDAFNAACYDLIGTAGITVADCGEVQDALDAVEMDGDWPCTVVQQGVPEACPDGQVAEDVFYDDFESGDGKWSFNVLTGLNPWSVVNGFSTSGTGYLSGLDLDSQSDSRAFMTSAVQLPANAFLHFNHVFEFETSNGTFWDGGRLEYTTNGSTWFDASPLISAGASYNGVLSSGNPLGAVSAFAGVSFGYTSTKLDLAAYAGQSLRIGFRVGTDLFVGAAGWGIDDVRIYTCGAEGLIFTDGFESGNVTKWSSSVP